MEEKARTKLRVAVLAWATVTAPFIATAFLLTLLFIPNSVLVTVLTFLVAVNLVIMIALWPRGSLKDKLKRDQDAGGE